MGQYSYKRNVRIAKLIERSMADILLEQRGLPVGQLSVVQVAVADNLTSATITLSISRLAHDVVEQTLAQLNNDVYKIRQMLAKRLKLRKMPHIKFDFCDFSVL